VLPRRDFLTKEACGCRKEAQWSQSPVLPWAQRAYETCLSAGSTAFELWKWSPHPELHQAGLLTEQAHRSKCFGGIEYGWRETTCTCLRSELRRGRRPRLPGSKPGGSAIPR
jgi:hypothetical protein